jgi:hypothetical protein
MKGWRRHTGLLIPPLFGELPELRQFCREIDVRARRAGITPIWLDRSGKSGDTHPLRITPLEELLATIFS